MAKKPLIFFKIMVYFSIENWYTFRLTNTYAKLTMYNFCEIITMNVVLQQKDRKHVYQVNFTAAIAVCLHYFKQNIDIPPIDVEALIQMNILPVRKGRSDPRKVKHKSQVSFTYRVA